MALSTASAPVFINKAISNPVSSVSIFVNGPSDDVWNARDDKVSF